MHYNGLHDILFKLNIGKEGHFSLATMSKERRLGLRVSHTGLQQNTGSEYLTSLYTCCDLCQLFSRMSALSAFQNIQYVVFSFPINA